jgi:DNA invertase Pin-like site-specific DNA recombinase
MPQRIYVDHELTGTNRERPGLREALAACRAATPWWSPSSTGSPDHCRMPVEILDDLTKRELCLGGSVHDPIDPVGRLLFNVLAVVAEFEAA